MEPEAIAAALFALAVVAFVAQCLITGGVPPEVKQELRAMFGKQDN